MQLSSDIPITLTLKLTVLIIKHNKIEEEITFA